jgi:hypothetical protein
MDPATQAAIVQQMGIFGQFVNWQLTLFVLGMVEVLKGYIPDDYEPRIIPPMSLGLGLVLSLIPALHLTIIIGAASGLAASMSYSLAKKALDMGSTAVKNALGIITPAPVVPAPADVPKPQ